MLATTAFALELSREKTTEAGTPELNAMDKRKKGPSVLAREGILKLNSGAKSVKFKGKPTFWLWSDRVSGDGGKASCVQNEINSKEGPNHEQDVLSSIRNTNDGTDVPSSTRNTNDIRGTNNEGDELSASGLASIGTKSMIISVIDMHMHANTHDLNSCEGRKELFQHGERCFHRTPEPSNVSRGMPEEPR